jgi:hypothetical protein
MDKSILPTHKFAREINSTELLTIVNYEIVKGRIKPSESDESPLF